MEALKLHKNKEGYEGQIFPTLERRTVEVGSLCKGESLKGVEMPRPDFGLGATQAFIIILTQGPSPDSPGLKSTPRKSVGESALYSGLFAVTYKKQSLN